MLLVGCNTTLESVGNDFNGCLCMALWAVNEDLMLIDPTFEEALNHGMDRLIGFIQIRHGCIATT